MHALLGKDSTLEMRIFSVEAILQKSK